MYMSLPDHKTRIVCTIGPASNNPAMLEKMINAGMNIARLNFSHGEFTDHKSVIENIRAASRAAGKRVAIMGDLPGPKMRIGKLDEEPFELQAGDTFTLTTEDITGNRERVSMSFPLLPRVVKPGDSLFLNDGIIHLEVLRVDGSDVECRVVVGGELRSRKGLNLPGIDLGISAFTDRDHACLKFAMENGVDAVSQSFVETSADVEAVRKAAKELGQEPFIIAKIERSGALKHMDQILQAADGIMIARGDLGVEIPIEEMAVVQKNLMEKAVVAGKPVITATQMLESMTDHSRPTRAEATDVANAILDGTDCVMLSGESAMGKFPVESVAMLSKIAKATEPHRPRYRRKEFLDTYGLDKNISRIDLIALSVYYTLERSSPAAIFVPTMSGATARNIARFRMPVWVIAVSPSESTCQKLQFSYGVHTVCEPEHPDRWKDYARKFIKEHHITGSVALLTEGPSTTHPEANNRMEIIDLTGPISQ
jgi:pyruvate kinase